MRHLYTLFFSCLCFLSLVLAQSQDYCDAATPCKNGCCSQYNKCGFGPDYCENCLNNCNATAECGKYASDPDATCPLGVCCSGYGYCGTTDDFCTTQVTADGTEYPCQSGCLPVLRPECPVDTDAMHLPRRIGYYELWAQDRPCDKFPPEQIAGGALTHINIAFAGITEDYSITDDSSQQVARIAHLKELYPGLRVNIAIGGWAFNDPPTQTRFSDMSSSSENRNKFITSCVRFIRKYGLDGVDIDWEYPEADDRGGVPADYDNYVKLLQDFRDRFSDENPDWEITITIPASYWYLRHFDIKKMEPLVDWFNMMTYDIHGLWDQGNIWTGPFLKGHTNITEIDEALDLLWRNAIKPENVVMGFGFYGRSFTMSDPSCADPGCTFDGAGAAGPCSDTEGILTYAEVYNRNYTLNDIRFHYDEVSTVKYEIFAENQWISYDDAQSFHDKKEFLSKRCLGGLMIWALDQDTQNYDALAGLLGNGAVQDGLIKGGNLSDSAKASIVDEFSAFTGQNCYVTSGCTDETRLTDTSRQRCKAGYTAVDRAHNPRTENYGEELDTCKTGYWHQICCPTEHLPQDCSWEANNDNPSVPLLPGQSGPVDGQFCPVGIRVFAEQDPKEVCPDGKFQLSEDTALNKEGTKNCFSGTRRALCCKSNTELQKCRWTKCGNSCNDNEKSVAARQSDRYGTLCDFMGDPPNLNIMAYFCCPKDDAYENCEWGREALYGDGACTPKMCDKTKLEVTEALVPEPFLGIAGSPNSIANCGAKLPTNDAGMFPLCCDPPSEFKEHWPVDPAKLWANPHYEDVEWQYSDEYSNNDEDKDFSGPTAYGDDAYGFIMLDGPDDLISGSFDDDFTVVHSDPNEPQMKKRSLITHDRRTLESTFDHKEETVQVYCNHESGSPQCDKIFKGGVEDKIIKLPSHVGEGPFGRVVSMQRLQKAHLPQHHVESRALHGNTNDVWELKFDYNFHLIKRQSDDGQTVNMRVDYTNLLPYWDEMTAGDPDKKKRSTSMPPPPRPGSPEFADLLRRSDEAKRHNTSIRADVDFSQTHSEQVDEVPEVEPKVVKRWFGTFVNWLKKMNTVESKDSGDLDMSYTQSRLIYSKRKGCPKAKLQAGLDVHADAQLNLNSRYAYYVTGTIVPPHVDDTFAYFAIQPDAYLGIRVNGNARLRVETERKKLVDTLSYPGLSIRGLAAVGPTLDVYGQIKGEVQIAGRMQIGAKYTFEQSEVYFPRNSDSSSYQKIFGDSDEVMTQQTGLEPRFSADVKAEANLDVIVTPEANMGIQVLSIVDAQVSAFVDNTLRFHIDGNAQVDIDGDGATDSASFNYYVSYLWNVGIGSHGSCKPDFLGLGWNLDSLKLFPMDKEIRLWPTSGSSTKRSYIPDAAPVMLKAPRRGLLNAPDDETVYGVVPYVQMDAVDIWGNNTSLQKRLESSDVAAFVSGLMECPDAGTSCNGPGSVDDPAGGSENEKRTPNHSLLLRADGDGGGSGNNGQQQPTCTDLRPRFMYNCAFFPDEQINGVNQQNRKQLAIIPGICRNIRNGMQVEGVSNEYDLTYEPTNRDMRDNRPWVCGNTVCRDKNLELADKLGQGNSLTSCDEFPFGSTENGGRQNSPQRAVTSCVPTYQQTLQGNCNGLLANLESDVNYDPNDANATPLWKGWDLNSAWLTPQTWNPAVNDPNYPPYDPGSRSYGFPGNRPNENTVEKHRRYVFSLIDTTGNSPTGPTDFIDKPFSSATFLSGGAVAGRQNVMCAVSTQENPNLRVKSSSFNGYCWDGTVKAQGMNKEWLDVPTFKGCNVYFGSGVRKREIIGSEIVEDSPVVYGSAIPRDTDIDESNNTAQEIHEEQEMKRVREHMRHHAHHVHKHGDLS